MKCRHCGTKLVHTFIDLGSSPPSNSYLTTETLKRPEKWFPLKVLVCEACWLVQTDDFVGASEMFSKDYAYFSSYSTSWVQHAKKYVESVVKKFSLDSLSNVVEIAANDGYLLQFVQEKAIPCYGIEPTSSTANAAREKGIEIFEDFFGVKKAEELSAQGKQADLMVANNVLAHVPDINDFISGFSRLLKSAGVATFEFPHLLNLVEQKQFDTIYHEHYSYLSLRAVCTIFQSNGLNVFDVEKLPTHGGSLRVYAQRLNVNKHLTTASVNMILSEEEKVGIQTINFYENFQEKAEKVKNDLLLFLLEAKQNNKKVVAYGAAAKGNTMLNFAGVRPDLISYVIDRNPAKQGKFMPGSRIPIVKESILKEDRPDYILILPWNLRHEIAKQLNYVNEWGGVFVSAVPEMVVQ